MACSIPRAQQPIEGQSLLALRPFVCNKKWGIMQPVQEWLLVSASRHPDSVGFLDRDYRYILVNSSRCWSRSHRLGKTTPPQRELEPASFPLVHVQNRTASISQLRGRHIERESWIIYVIIINYSSYISSSKAFQPTAGLTSTSPQTELRDDPFRFGWLVKGQQLLAF
jgi:hypothetical protein